MKDEKSSNSVMFAEIPIPYALRNQLQLAGLNREVRAGYLTYPVLNVSSWSMKRSADMIHILQVLGREQRCQV